MPTYNGLESALIIGFRCESANEGSFDKNYVLFLDQFVRASIGCALFDSFVTNKRLSEFVGVTDEALALLMYENQEERWKDMAANGLAKSTKPGKYTDGGKSREKTGRSRKGKGWSGEGIKRFNVLCKHVERCRGRQDRKDMEQWYLATKQAEALEAKDSKKRKCNAMHYAEDEVVVDEVYVEPIRVVGV